MAWTQTSLMLAIMANVAHNLPTCPAFEPASIDQDSVLCIPHHILGTVCNRLTHTVYTAHKCYAKWCAIHSICCIQRKYDDSALQNDVGSGFGPGVV